jgi:LytS/YehU family sensor histidine kinase
MSSIINRFLGKKSVRNEELLALADRLSFRNSQLDSFLIGHFIQRDKTDPVDYFAFQEQLLKLHVDRFEAIQVELNLLNQYLQLAERFLPAGFSVKWENKLQFQDEIMLPPLIIFPVVQHAVENGYNTMSSHPVRIRLSGSSKLIMLEVSYRVNHYLESQFSSTLIRDFRQRLDYLFPEKHNLLMNSNSNTSRITLTIQL